MLHLEIYSGVTKHRNGHDSHMRILHNYAIILRGGGRAVSPRRGSGRRATSGRVRPGERGKRRIPAGVGLVATRAGGWGRAVLSGCAAREGGSVVERRARGGRSSPPRGTERRAAHPALTRAPSGARPRDERRRETPGGRGDTRSARRRCDECAKRTAAAGDAMPGRRKASAAERRRDRPRTAKAGHRRKRSAEEHRRRASAGRNGTRAAHRRTDGPTEETRRRATAGRGAPRKRRAPTSEARRARAKRSDRPTETHSRDKRAPPSPCPRGDEPDPRRFPSPSRRKGRSLPLVARRPDPRLGDTALPPNRKIIR